MPWTINKLALALETHPEWSSHEQDDALIITNPEGLSAYLAVSGQQILIESLLFRAAQVKDPAKLNALILRTHHLFPLTAIAINEIDGEDYYVAFGALATESKLENIGLEVELLFSNIEAFLEAYQEHLNLEAE